jgi:hypothetical protein
VGYTDARPHGTSVDRPTGSTLRKRSIAAGCVAGVFAFAFLVCSRQSFALGIYGHSDAPWFLAVAKHPFGSGHPFPGDPLIQGVAYRYGRIMLPLFGWLLGAGQPRAVPWSLAIAFALSVWLLGSVLAEVAGRSRLRRAASAVLLACPFTLLWLNAPAVVSEPLAAGLVILAYLFDRDGNQRAARISAAAALLTRESALLAIVPLIARAWKTDGRSGLRRWMMVGLPYAAWSLWVLLRVGALPVFDPASDRRRAFVAPFVGWFGLLRQHPAGAQIFALVIGVLTIAAALTVLARSPRPRMFAWAAVSSSVIIACFGPSVWNLPTEALRVMLPTHALFIVAIFDLRRKTKSQP